MTRSRTAKDVRRPCGCRIRYRSDHVRRDGRAQTIEGLCACANATEDPSGVCWNCRHETHSTGLLRLPQTEYERELERMVTRWSRWETYATDDELERARIRGREQRRDALSRGSRERFDSLDDEEIQDTHFLGALGEIIASRVTGLRLVGGRKLQDIGERTEVRTTDHPQGKLPIRKADPVHRCALLVTGSGRGPFCLRGWIEIADARRIGRVETSWRYPVIAIPQSALRPLPLPDDA